MLEILWTILWKQYATAVSKTIRLYVELLRKGKGIKLDKVAE